MNARAIELLYATGHWLLSNGRTREAAEVLQLMVLTKPSDERGWLALGACHESHGQKRLAIELYKLAEVAAAPAVRCAIACGRALRDIDQVDAADERFELAHGLALSSGDVDLAALAAMEKAAS